MEVDTSPGEIGGGETVLMEDDTSPGEIGGGETILVKVNSHRAVD